MSISKLVLLIGEYIPSLRTRVKARSHDTFSRGPRCCCQERKIGSLLVFIEITADPGHRDGEGEDGEADDEEEFVAHDVESMSARERW